MTTPGKLTVSKDGRITGPATITYNQPWPCPNGTPGVTGKMSGVLMHTMVTDLPQCITWFNNPKAQASAHFGIAQDGTIHQFGPLGTGWEAWHAMAANPAWYGIEHADHGNPDNPLTDAQIIASAQVVECLSAFADFPLRITNDPGGLGYGTHSMGGAAWGGHTCPDRPPEHVRSSQRPAIIALAKQIRAGASAPGPFPAGRHQVSDHSGTLAQLAARQACDVASIWRATIVNLDAAGDPLGPLQRRYLNAGNWDARMPHGMIVWLP